MPPIFLLLLVCVVSAVAVAIARWRAQRERHVLQRLAIEHRLHFSRRDQLRLAPRVAECLPVPGAAGVAVSNLLYGSSAGLHWYVFTVEYTLGTMRRRERVRRAAAFSEPRERGGGSGCAVKLGLAPTEMELVEQYRSLLGGR